MSERELTPQERELLAEADAFRGGYTPEDHTAEPLVGPAGPGAVAPPARAQDAGEAGDSEGSQTPM